MRRVRSSHNYLLFPFHPIRFILDAVHGGHKDKCKCKLQVKLSEVQHQHQHQHHLLLASCMSYPIICTLAQGSRVARTVPIVREHSTAKYLPVCRRVPPSLPFAQGRSLQPCCASCSKHNPIFVILPVLGKKRSSTHPVGCGCVPVPSPPAPKRSTALPSPPPAAHDSPVPMWLCCRAAAHCPRRHRCRFLALFFLSSLWAAIRFSLLDLRFLPVRAFPFSSPSPSARFFFPPITNITVPNSGAAPVSVTFFLRKRVARGGA